MTIVLESYHMIGGLVGGVLIGLSASLLWLTHGRVAGISGLLGSLIRDGGASRDDSRPFILGLIIAGVVGSLVTPTAFGQPTIGLAGVVAAGLLVGYGTRQGSGCTSGHGVCGISRFSRRSLAATATFGFTGGLTVFALRALGVLA